MFVCCIGSRANCSKTGNKYIVYIYWRCAGASKCQHTFITIICCKAAVPFSFCILYYHYICSFSYFASLSHQSFSSVFRLFLQFHFYLTFGVFALSFVHTHAQHLFNLQLNHVNHSFELLTFIQRHCYVTSTLAWHECGMSMGKFVEREKKIPSLS